MICVGSLIASDILTSVSPIPLSVSPNTGTMAGGTAITITGTGFTSPATAALSGAACTSVVVVNSTTITAVTPAHATGATTLRVTNTTTGFYGDLPSAFTYASAGPTLAAVSTSGGAVGDIAGGYPATLTGTNFTGATGVTFGGTPATSLVVVSSTSITCVVPAHAYGAVSVLVTTPGGTNGANTAFEYFSPAQLATTEWQRGSYSLPWAGNGTSSGRTMTTAGSNPTAGTALNGLTPASFASASSQLLNSAAAVNVLFGTTGGFFCLFKATTAPALSGTAYGDGTFCSDSNAEVTAGFTVNGVNGVVYDGAFKRVDVAASTGAWHLAQFRYDGTNLQVRVDGGSWSSVACGNYTPAAPGTSQVGHGYGGAFYNGLIEEWCTAAYAIATTDFDKIRSYINSRYFPGGAQI